MESAGGGQVWEEQEGGHRTAARERVEAPLLQGRRSYRFFLLSVSRFSFVPTRCLNGQRRAAARQSHQGWLAAHTGRDRVTWGLARRRAVPALLLPPSRRPQRKCLRGGGGEGQCRWGGTKLLLLLSSIRHIIALCARSLQNQS